MENCASRVVVNSTKHHLFSFFLVFGACILNFNFLHRSTCADKEPVHVWAPSEADISNIREYEHILFCSTTDSKRERKKNLYF